MQGFFVIGIPLSMLLKYYVYFCGNFGYKSTIWVGKKSPQLSVAIEFIHEQVICKKKFFLLDMTAIFWRKFLT